MKKKTTKRALLLSGLALFLCVSMLIGSTYAWFTDSVTSSGNIIKSGTLDVEMSWANGTEAPESASWTDASTGAIFNNDKWEPGYTEVRHVKIENKGSLALKYQLTIQANGEVTDLADVIDVYYIDPATQISFRTDLTADTKLGTLTEVLEVVSSDASGNLEAGASHCVTIALKMQESAGNEYQNKSIGADFSVILSATQLDFEADSFDTEYDKGLRPLEEGEILKEESGIQYVYTPDGDAILYLVTEDYAEDTVVIPEGIKSIGNYAFAYNSDIKEVVLSSTVRSLGRGFDSSAVEKVVLNEGLEVIDSRAFKGTTNLKEVVISSTVKTIADNAFQKSAIKEIVIPANVETVGETAFGSSSIEKVTFEGDIAVQGYAFRGCKNLRTVVMEGEDVSFIPSTLNGRNSCWFCNGESNNPGTSNITFYVENETVAERVKTAMGAEAGNTKIYVDGKITIKVNSNEEFASTLATAQAGTVIDATGLTLVPVRDINITVLVPAGVTVKGATFAPTGEAFVLLGAGEEAVVFENCSFTCVDRGTYQIATNGADAVFTNCQFKGQFYTNCANVPTATYTYENCSFTLSEGAGSIGYVNCYGGNHNFNGCTFDYTGGATYGSNQYLKWNSVHAYGESRYPAKVVLTGCTRINCGTSQYGSASITVK